MYNNNNNNNSTNAANHCATSPEYAPACCRWVAAWAAGLRTDSSARRLSPRPRVPCPSVAWPPRTADAALCRRHDDVDCLHTDRLTTTRPTVALPPSPSCNHTQCLSDLVVSGVRGPRFESHPGRLCLSPGPLRCAVLGTGCASFLLSLGQLSLASLRGR